MKNTEYKQFINENKLEDKIPTHIKDKIVVDEKMEETLGKLAPEDQQEHLEKKKNLELEILDDLHEHFADDMENNDIIEEAPKKVDPPVAKEDAPEKKVEPKPENEDEKIIDKLVKNGYDRIKRENLRALGFKGLLENKVHFVGKYTLTKEHLSFTYKINSNE